VSAYNTTLQEDFREMPQPALDQAWEELGTWGAIEADVWQRAEAICAEWERAAREDWGTR
jgi:hypothetical protein